MRQLLRLFLLCFSFLHITVADGSDEGNTLEGRATHRRLTTKQTVLILASNNDDAKAATFMLDSYGMTWQTVVIPQSGVGLPILNKTTPSGRLEGQYGLIVVYSEVSYNYGTSYKENWHSALTTAQWNDLYNYQKTFGVRMVQLNVYPNLDDYGAEALGGCCTDDEQMLYLDSTVQSARFPQAGMKSTSLSTDGLWHYPASIPTSTNRTTTTPFLYFSPNSDFSDQTVGAVINTYKYRQQMAFFITFAAWSPTASYLSHLWIQWGTRGLYQGFRRAHLGTQVDDLFLPTQIFTSPNTTYRLTTDDLDNHATWSQNINSRLTSTNPGSVYFLEFGFNGNGNLLASEELDMDRNVCKAKAIRYIDGSDWIETPLEFEKTLGTGMNVWPKHPTTFYNYTLDCMQLDPVAKWIMTPATRDNFAYVTHTYTHLSLNNATYHDVYREIRWNKEYAAFTGISNGKYWSKGGLIPPAITGLHNGDALQAFWDNGLRQAVGDNTRPVLRSPINVHWPLITNKSASNFDGFYITPRFATRIYFNCDTADCTVAEWIATSKVSNVDMSALLDTEKESTSNQLLALYHDPYMFHQANLRTSNINSTLVNGSNQKLSLIQCWVETVVAEYQRLVSWPLITLKHDDIAASFKSRRIRDRCNPRMKALYSKDGKSIISFTVSTTNNNCARPIPVTVVGGLSSIPAGVTMEQVGNDPPTAWVTMTGSTVSLALKTPIPVWSL